MRILPAWPAEHKVPYAFRTVIPLTPIAVEKVGPQEAIQVTPQDAILAFCTEPRSKAEIMQHCGYQDSKNFTRKYLRALLESGKLKKDLWLILSHGPSLFSGCIFHSPIYPIVNCRSCGRLCRLLLPGRIQSLVHLPL